MSYQYYLQYINHLMALGMYSVPIPNTTMVLPPTFLPIQSVQPLSIPMNETITLESDSDENDVDERTLFCANLDENVSEELLYEVFIQAGPIQKIHIPKDNAGKKRSYGFVTFKHCSTPPYAVRLYHGLVLFQKRLDIKLQGKYNFNNYRMQ